MELEELIDHSLYFINSSMPLEAKRLCLKAIELSPNCEVAWNNLALAEIRLQKPEQALDAANKAISIDPFFPEAWHNLGEAYLLMNMPKESLHCNNRALTFPPIKKAPEVWIGKAKALLHLERYDEAIASLNEVIKLNPDFSLRQTIANIALLLQKEAHRKLLFTALDIAFEFSQGKLDSNGLLEKLARIVSDNKNVFNKKLVKLFDSFAELNINAKKSSILSFCFVNKKLAEILNDEVLITLCAERLDIAKFIFKV